MIKDQIDVEDKTGLDKLILLFMFIFAVTLLLLWLTEHRSDNLTPENSRQATKIKHQTGQEKSQTPAVSATAVSLSRSKSIVTQAQPQRVERAETTWEDRFRIIPSQPLPDEKTVGDYTIAEHMVFKEQYYCDLAEQARAQCESHPDESSYKRCLSLRSYFTYSRHCGYQP
ncbi:MAG: hypothetical protein DBP03_04780 [gamma proteobacterium symbiont of Ctena orbiculata]|nr:MAG: hypothetical protein DBP03_04780 [gamma proteobacterium symbiont of Ctena orbiculata]PUB79391.1 MAG: hypothetical protein DBO99_04570 [gamma proteobacterium symbiont of Ctena orbiculata]